MAALLVSIDWRRIVKVLCLTVGPSLVIYQKTQDLLSFMISFCSLMAAQLDRTTKDDGWARK